MHYTTSKNSIDIQLDKDFNLVAAQQIDALVGSKNNVRLDLTHARLVDSEAIAMLHRYMLEGRRVILKNPPKIFYEVIRILGLHTHWNLDELIDPSSDRH